MYCKHYGKNTLKLLVVQQADDGAAAPKKQTWLNGKCLGNGKNTLKKKNNK